MRPLTSGEAHHRKRVEWITAPDSLRAIRTARSSSASCLLPPTSAPAHRRSGGDHGGCPRAQEGHGSVRKLELARNFEDLQANTLVRSLRYSPGLHKREHTGIDTSRQNIGAVPGTSFYGTERRRFRPQTHAPPVPTQIEGTMEDRRDLARRRMRGKNRLLAERRVEDSYVRGNIAQKTKDWHRVRGKARDLFEYASNTVNGEVTPNEPGHVSIAYGLNSTHKYSPYLKTELW